MASSINASTSGAGGVITTADNSGILNLQSNGTTVATVSSTGFSTPANQTINTANTFGFKNRIINGGMTINQRGNPATVNGTQIFVSDRWRTGSNATSGWGSGAFSSSQSTDAPSGFINSTLLTVTTAYTPSGNVAATLVQPIEGLNIADLAWGTSSAKTVTLSFWVKSSLTGTFSGMLASNGSTTRGYVFSYAISVANTWEQKTITIAGDVSSASNWLTTNGVGMFVRFSLGAAGTSLYSTANTWFNMTVEDGLTGQTNLVATNGATWRLTGVQLEVGSQATSFDFRDYGRELAMCQRYYTKFTCPDSTVFMMGIINVTTNVYGGGLTLPSTMRTTPTLAQSNLRTYDATTSSAISAIASNQSSKEVISAEFTTSGMIVGRSAIVSGNASSSAFISASAEL